MLVFGSDYRSRNGEYKAGDQRVVLCVKPAPVVNVVYRRASEACWLLPRTAD